MERAAYYQSPIGTLQVIGDDTTIWSIAFVENEDRLEENPSSYVLSCLQQLDEYFIGERLSFDLAYSFIGTSFQKKVWQVLGNIPYATTVSYKTLALALGSEKLVRAVGLANGKNPLSIVVPCHRVIGSNGKLVGYSGGLWRKQWLLTHEQKFSKSKLTLF